MCDKTAERAESHGKSLGISVVETGCAPIRPFTVNGAQTLVYVNVNGLLGFEIGDLRTGEFLHRIDVTDQGFEAIRPLRHGVYSHGVGLTPDEKEVWVVDGANRRLHIYDNTVMPPSYVESIQLRAQPGWITFSLDGRHACAPTGEVIDVATRKIITQLRDENGVSIKSEKMLEAHVTPQGNVLKAGDQFGLGRVRPVTWTARNMPRDAIEDYVLAGRFKPFPVRLPDGRTI